MPCTSFPKIPTKNGMCVIQDSENLVLEYIWKAILPKWLAFRCIVFVTTVHLISWESENIELSVVP